MVQTKRDRAGDAAKRRGTGRTRRGRDTRVRLVAAARRVFERDGFYQSRVADICEQAGISQPSFYTYFHTKEEIFREVVASVDTELLKRPESGPDDGPIERLRAANRRFLEFYRDNAAILSVIDQVNAFDQELRADRFAESQQGFARAIKRRIRFYQDEGFADPRVDPGFAAVALGNMVFGTASEMFLRRETTQADLDRAVDQLTLLWANAVGLRDPRTADTASES